PDANGLLPLAGKHRTDFPHSLSVEHGWVLPRAGRMAKSPRRRLWSRLPRDVACPGRLPLILSSGIEELSHEFLLRASLEKAKATAVAPLGRRPLPSPG